ATGRPGRNLDPFLCVEDSLVPLLLHGAAVPEQADAAVIEGVMGLFDGRIGGDGFASTAHVARVVGAPIVLVLDISQVSRTAAALVHGLTTFDPETRIAGVILNKAGSRRHSDEVVQAMEATGIPVLGVLPRDAGIEAPSRHLGLVPVAERPRAQQGLDRLAAQIAEHIDVTKVLAIAHSAPPMLGHPWDPNTALSELSAPVVARAATEADNSERVREQPVVAVAGGRAFTFRYPETTELLSAAGLRPVVFDPTVDSELPPGTAGLYLGGGFPEVHAGELAANSSMITALRRAIRAGMPTVAECAGLLYLCRTVDDVTMVGAIEAAATMTRTLTLGYRTAIAPDDHLLGVTGRRVTGHEFHRTVVTPSVGDQPAWLVDGVPVGFSLDPADTGTPSVHASYLHLHWAGHPSVAARFAGAVHTFADRLLYRKPQQAWIPEQNSVDLGRGDLGQEDLREDLGYHGDRDLGDGLVDLAVNVRIPRPPGWLAEVIKSSFDDLAAYPDSGPARAAIADAHRVGPDEVLPSAGGAELFSLVARARAWSAPSIVHPQFTEPEAALRAAGYRPRRVILHPENGFRLDPDLIPDHADLVIIGNPTNPTSVLHPAASLRSLLRPGRVVVIDEAFSDAVPGEPETMISTEQAPGLLVLRSLTKTWGLAGLRAGYAVGDPGLIADLAAQQPPWSVSTPAAAAMLACMSERARAAAAAAAEETTRRRDHLVAALADLGLDPVPAPRAPFVLVDTQAWLPGQHGPGAVRGLLRERGFAVRRGETFPGLGPDWIRLAVRDPETTDALAKTLRAIREEL
ncbi:MAG: Rv2231c family pyridoxal phosphate-dependent protein CobC, partial [Microlunatus sp.]|nr:Rv2231c family pyridoxal phosphate-dependent protein CobC [Microlunatus sp.]